jgi:hypothetical protein
MKAKKEALQGNMGYDAARNEYVDLVGISVIVASVREGRTGERFLSRKRSASADWATKR